MFKTAKRKSVIGMNEVLEGVDFGVPHYVPERAKALRGYVEAESSCFAKQSDSIDVSQVLSVRESVSLIVRAHTRLRQHGPVYP